MDPAPPVDPTAAAAATIAPLQAALTALEGQRGVLGDAVVERAMAPLRAQLDAALGQPPRQRLTHATVLFADVVGSTALAGQLDPEDMHEVLDGAMRSLTALVGLHGGRVLQYAGDGLLAVFGADRAQEDDAERAVRAGLAMLAQAQRQPDGMQRPHGGGSGGGGAGFGLRVGVHGGPVLLGGGVDGDASIRGQTVHIAARMEQTAPAGGLRISQDVFRQVRGAFEAEVQPPLQIKGATAPMTTYLVTRALPDALRRPGRGVEGLTTSLVGRAAELALLADSHDAVAKSGRCRCTVLVGEAGVGKSRLLSEFMRLVGHEARVWSARGQAQRLHQPYALLREMFFGRAGIHDGDSQAQAQDKLAAALHGVFAERAEEHTALLGQLLGLDYRASPHVRGIAEQGRQVRDRGLHSAALWLAHAARADEAPLLLWLDDLHWADEASLDALKSLLPACADVPMLVLCASRDALWPDSTGTAPPQVLQRLTLEPLDGAARAELADTLLGSVGAVGPVGTVWPPALRALVADTAGGNPFFMEELTQMLLDELAADTPSTAPETPLPRRLPATVAGVIQTRLDVLSPAERATLECASVIGAVFWDEVLCEMHPAAAVALPELQRQGLARPHGASSFEGTREFAFRHHLFHQATYDGVLRRHKTALHAQVAAWLDRRSAARPGEWHAVIAAHLEQAGDPAAAAHRWGLAAEASVSRGALSTTLAQLDRALALCQPQDDRSRFPLLLARNWAEHLLGDAAASEATLDDMAQIAQRLGDAEWRAVTANGRSRLLSMSGRPREALAAALQALELAASALPQTRALAEFQTAVAQVGLGDYAAALAHGAQALALLNAVRGDTPPNQRPAFLTIIGTACLHTHDRAGAARHFQQALDLHRANGDVLAESATLGMLGDLSRTLGDHAQARSTLQAVLVLCQRLGNRRSQVYAHLNLSLVELNDGRLAEAQRHALDAGQLSQAMSDHWAHAVASTNLGHVCLAQGDTTGAHAAYLYASQQLEGLGAMKIALEPLAGLAATALACGDAARAAELAQQVEQRLTAGATLEGLDEPLRLRWACHRALAAAGDPRADDVLQRAHAELLAMARGVDEPAARQAFLSQSEAHRGMAAAWAAREAAGAR